VGNFVLDGEDILEVSVIAVAQRCTPVAASMS